MQAWTKTCISLGLRPYWPQAGFGENGFATATLGGYTGRSLPLIHSTSRSFAVRRAVGVPGEIPLDRRPHALVQRVDDLLVVDRADFAVTIRAADRRPRLGGVVVDVEPVPP